MVLPEYVVDTHALYWHLLNAPQLGPAAARVFLEAEKGQALLLIPSIVLAELYYLIRKHGKSLDPIVEYHNLASKTYIEFVDFQAADVLFFDLAAAVPEMHDRIIVGVAMTRHASILTKDQSIVNSGLVPTIW